MIIEEMLQQELLQQQQQHKAMLDEKKNDTPSKIELANSACEREWRELQESNNVKLSQEVDTKFMTSQQMQNVLESDGNSLSALLTCFAHNKRFV